MGALEAGACRQSARTPERVGDGLRLETRHQALAGLDEQLEAGAAQHGALRPGRAGRLQLGQAVQRGRHVHLVERLDALGDLVQDLQRMRLIRLRSSLGSAPH